MVGIGDRDAPWPAPAGVRAAWPVRIIAIASGALETAPQGSPECTPTDAGDCADRTADGAADARALGGLVAKLGLDALVAEVALTGVVGHDQVDVLRVVAALAA